VAKCRIDSFRLRGTGSVCHMFLLNVEFSHACRDKFFGNVFVRFYFAPFKQLLQYTLLKSFTVPSAVLTKFSKKFDTKLLASAFIFTKLSIKHFCFDAAVFHLSIQGYCKTRPHRSNCFLSMFKLRCKGHYRNLATYSWCTT